MCLWACKHEIDSDNLIESELQDTLIFGNAPFEFPKLSSEVNSIVKDWPVFNDFRGVSINFQNSTIEDLKRKSKNLQILTDSLSRSLPDSLNSPPIVSRITVIQTRVQLLHQEAEMGKPKPEKINLYIEELRKSIINFVLQINEKVEKDLIDFQRKDDEAKELEQQRKVRDSIFQLELEDQFP